MPQSLKQRTPTLPGRAIEEPIRQLLTSVLTDLTAIRTFLNTHVHSGITSGGSNTAVPTTQLAALDLTA